jgi:hypothetical protein
MRSIVTSLFFAFVIAACSKKPAPDATFTTSCVLTDLGGAVFQCFEQSNDQPRAVRKALCDEYEGATKELRDGPCPGPNVGVCDTHDGHRFACYRDPAGCEDGCKKNGGTVSH